MHSIAKTLVIGVVSAFLHTFSLSAASAPDFSFRGIGVRDGLPSNTVRALCQDADGMMWFGTGAGLVSYDGYTVTRYPLASGAESGCLEYVNALVADGRGTVWAGTDDGLFFKPAGTAVFEKLIFEVGTGTALDVVVTDLAMDKDENLWVATFQSGVFFYNTHNGKLKQYFLDGHADIETIFVDSNNVVIAAANSGTNVVYTFVLSTDSFQPFYFSTPDAATVRVMAMCEDSSGTLYFGTWDSGVLRFDRGRRTAVEVCGPQGLTHVHKVFEYAPGEFLAGSDSGLMWFNVANGESRLFVNDEYDLSSISNKFVYEILRDKEGGMWMGTYFGGVSYVAPLSSSFPRHSLSRMAGSAESYLVSCFCEDGDGNVWVGSENGGIACYAPFDGMLKRSYTPVSDRAGLSSYNVHALMVDGGYLWIGNYGTGLDRMDLKTSKLKTYHMYSVYSLKKLDDGSLFAGTTSGVAVYEPGRDAFRQLFSTGETVLDLEQLPSGDILAATAGKGLFRYTPASGKWTCHTAAPDCPDSLNCNFINSMFVDSDGSVLMGTREGLCKYDPRSEKFRKIDLGVDCDALFVTGDGLHVWITTANGIICLAIADGSVHRYGRSEGIINEQFMVNSGIMKADGSIYVGTTSGFHTFYPHNIQMNRYVPPVIISSVTSGGNPVPTDGSARLPHSMNEFVVSYAALSYASPDKNGYRYKLEGFDKEWHEVGNRRNAPYTNLPGGKYRFVVQACNSDGVWNDKGASFTFSVKPHPLASPLASVFYLLVVAAAATALFLFNKRKYERVYEEKYDKAIKTRDEEDLAAKIQFVTMIAHEVRTPLSLITAPMENILSRQEELSDRTAEDLRIIDKNSRRLLKLINQLLDFSRVNASGGIKIECADCDVVDLTKSVCERFMPSIEKNAIEFNSFCPVEKLEAWIDPEAYTKILSNLLSNAVKYTKDSVSLSLSVDDDVFSVVISDNGRGMSSLEKRKLFTPFYRVDENKPGTGIGLVIVKQLVEAHQGTIIVNSTEGTGSEFLVTLPIRRDMLGKTVQEENVLPTAEVSGHEESVPDLSGKEPHLLIVEDDEDMRRFLVAEFSGEYNVLSASDGDKAKEILKEKNVSLVISDWMMPGTDGAQLCRFIREERNLCHIPFILLTAKSDDGSVLESLDLGADAHVKKPFSPEHLHALVAHLVKMRGMLARKYSSSAPIPQEIKTAAAEPEKDLLSRVNEIVAANISNTELSVEMLCSELCMSRSALFTKVKAVSGTTPNNIILEARLKSAAALLAAGKYSISEISYMVGFNSPSYFSKCFQRQYGVTPHDWHEDKS